MFNEFIKRSPRPCLFSLALAAGINGYVVLAMHGAVSSWGSFSLLYPILLIIGVLVFYLLTFPVVFLLMLSISGSRAQCARRCLHIVIYLGVGIACVRLGNYVQDRGFHRFAERSTPLITALQRYQAVHGQSPPSLTTLVPDFLTQVPTTGMGGYPDYEYQSACWDNPWCLIVVVPVPPFGRDRLLYFPPRPDGRSVNYEGLRRFGAWFLEMQD